MKRFFCILVIGIFVLGSVQVPLNGENKQRTKAEQEILDVLKKFQDADLDLSTFQKTMHRLVKGAQDKMLAARIDEHISKKYPLGLTAPVQEEGHQGFDAKDFEKEGTQ